MNRTYSMAPKSNDLNRTVTLVNTMSSSFNVPPHTQIRPTLFGVNVNQRQRPVPGGLTNVNNNNDTTFVAPLTSSMNKFNTTLEKDTDQFELFDPFIMSLVDRCQSANVNSSKADNVTSKVNLKKHKEEIVASKLEIQKLEKEIAEEEARVEYLEKLTLEVKENHAEDIKRLKAQKKDVKIEIMQTKEEHDELTIKLKNLFDGQSIAKNIMGSIGVNPQTLCCPEGKKVLGDEISPAECDILKCPAARKKES